MDSEEQAVPVLLNVLSDILLIKVNLSNNFFQCICTLLKLFDLSFCHSHWNFALYTICPTRVNVLRHTSSIPYSPCIIVDTVEIDSERRYKKAAKFAYRRGYCIESCTFLGNDLTARIPYILKHCFFINRFNILTEFLLKVVIFIHTYT